MVSRPSPLLVLHSKASILRSKGKSEVVGRPTRKEASMLKVEPVWDPSDEVEVYHLYCNSLSDAVGWAAGTRWQAGRRDRC